MRVIRWFGLFLIGVVAMSGTAAAGSLLDGWAPVGLDESTLVVPVHDSRLNATAAGSHGPDAVNETPPTADDAANEVPDRVRPASLPHVAIAAPTIAAHAPSAEPETEDEDEHAPGRSSGEGAQADGSDDASSEGDEGSGAGVGPWVPPVSVPGLPVPLLPSPAVPGLHAPHVALPDEQQTTPAATHDAAVTPASASTSPAGMNPDAISAVVAAAVAGVALALVAASGTVGTTWWSPSMRPLSCLRRVLGLPLYARVSKDQVLDHATRQELLDRLRVMPGACFAELHAASGVSLNTIRHHLRVLQANGVVTSVKNGRRRCFFALDPGLSAAARVQAAALSAPAPRRVFRAIERCPGIAQQELASTLGVTPTSVSFHARRLLEAGVVRAERSGRALVYYPSSP